MTAFQERRQLLLAAGAASLTACFHADAVASDPSWPSKPIRLIVPFGAGSGADNMARVVADELRVALNVPVVIDNKPGTNGALGAGLITKAQPDGYTLGITGSSSNSAAPWLMKNVGYDAVNDFAHIANLVTIPLVLCVNETSRFKTMQELVDFAGANPGKLTYGYGSSSQQATAATFASMAKIKALPVPYKTVPQVITDLLGGQVDYAWLDVSVAGPQLKAGKLRALAAASPARITSYPTVPTLAENGITTFNLIVWVGIAAPPGTPPEILARVNADLEKISRNPEFRKRLESQGFDVKLISLAEHKRHVQQQYDSWGKGLREAGVQPE
ncbi:Bug family tripartite tricarboxylate transporter substrate binding protein [Ottowia thiooxydans]|uniref:Bug family tripartite tricarboxylate transporter substrate binding protein n=1 Tax=Ottowia thiooxydans TaxID=219182 RepID=UPI000411077C|nr:tripartite tricarboxylate transporter substrate binding protein [Ottowia thiooxydans]